MALRTMIIVPFILIAISYKLLLAMSVGALIFVSAEPFLHEILAQLCFVLSSDLLLIMTELALVSLLTLVLEEIPTDPFPFELKELLQLRFFAYVDAIGRFVSVEDFKQGLFDLFHTSLHRLL